MADLSFAWRVCKHVKSNAIVYVKDGATVGVGAGQMSRVDSARIAARKAEDAARAAGLPEPLTKGSVVASDAFFPFADGLDRRGRGGRDRGHPARRLDARRRSDRGGGRGGRRDGVHRDAALPPLKGAAGGEHRSRGKGRRGFAGARKKEGPRTAEDGNLSNPALPLPTGIAVDLPRRRAHSIPDDLRREGRKLSQAREFRRGARGRLSEAGRNAGGAVVTASSGPAATVEGTVRPCARFFPRIDCFQGVARRIISASIFAARSSCAAFARHVAFLREIIARA